MCRSVTSTAKETWDTSLHRERMMHIALTEHLEPTEGATLHALPPLPPDSKGVVSQASSTMFHLSISYHGVIWTEAANCALHHKLEHVLAPDKTLLTHIGPVASHPRCFARSTLWPRYHRASACRGAVEHHRAWRCGGRRDRRETAGRLHYLRMSHDAESESDAKQAMHPYTVFFCPKNLGS